MSGSPGPEGAARVLDARTVELRDRLAAVRERIDAACGAVGRDPAEVHFIAVTKTFPPEDIARLAGLGVRDIGENRVQEAGPKIETAAELLGQRDFTVHFIGQVQTNKAGQVARWADHVHSVDRLRLVHALDRAATNADRRLGVLVQVALDGSGERGGALPSDVPSLCDAVVATSGLRLEGLMAVAPLGVDPDEPFARLAALADGIRADHPEATWLSAGMSGDLESAVAHGATHLRVGTAILRSRPSHR